MGRHEDGGKVCAWCVCALTLCVYGSVRESCDIVESAVGKLLTGPLFGIRCRLSVGSLKSDAKRGIKYRVKSSKGKIF